MRFEATLRGPGAVFARRPLVFAASLLGAGLAVAAMAVQAGRTSGGRRAAWSLLALGEAAIAAGIVRERRRALRGVPDELRPAP